jgi:integrase
MPQLKLTKRSVDAIGRVERPTYFFDTDLAGFFVRAMPSGAKAWGFEYRAGSGRSAPKRRVTIASFGKVTPEEARAAARTLAAEVAQGGDPATRKADRAKELTVAGLIDLYEAEGSSRLKPLTRSYTLARLRHHAVPLLGLKRVSDVRVADVERMIADVGAGRTARDERSGPRTRIIVRGGAGAARKVASDLSAVFAFAVRRGLASGNPARLADKPAEGRRETYLTLDDVRRLGAALERVEADGANPMAVNIIRLLVLTGCRRNEVAGLKWPEIDWERSQLRLQSTKTGRSVRPLGTAALQLLDGLPRHDGTDLVFPATSGQSHFQGVKKIWARVRTAAGLGPDVVLHTLRHTMASTAVSAGESLPMTGAILGHANHRSTAKYAHMQSDPARKAADRVTGPIAVALGGRERAGVTILAKARRS